MAKFSPYIDNGGSIVAIAGTEFVAIGADTRLSQNFSILSRNQSKLFPLTKNTVMGCTGCRCDTITLTKQVKIHLQTYEQEHEKVMSTSSIAQMLSNMLYFKRFFPYYVSCVLVGKDEKGIESVYSFDPIGHCEKSKYRAVGSAGVLLQPLLDNRIGGKNMTVKSEEPLTIDRALSLLKDAFAAASERDIYTGDCVDIHFITDNGIGSDLFFLRQD